MCFSLRKTPCLFVYMCGKLLIDFFSRDLGRLEASHPFKSTGSKDSAIQSSFSIATFSVSIWLHTVVIYGLKLWSDRLN